MSRVLLYIGNHLSVNGSYPSVAESLAPHMKPEVEFRLVSRKTNILLRLADMITAVLRAPKHMSPVILDVYSTLNFWYAVLVAVICRWRRLPYVAVLHGGDLPKRLERSRPWCKIVFGRAVSLVSPSPYLQNAFAGHGYRAMIIPNGLSIDDCSYEARRNIRPRLLWVRAFDRIYNPQMAIRVLHGLCTVHPEATLCMVGPDKDGTMDVCKQLVKDLGLDRHVTFTGRLPKADWISLSREYDIFLNTTDYDNTPVSVIEAMALGLPVVSTDAGGMPFLIDDGVNGLLVGRGNAKAMSEAVRKLIGDATLAGNLAFEARKRVELLDWKHIKPLWLEILDGDIRSDT